MHTASMPVSSGRPSQSFHSTCASVSATQPLLLTEFLVFMCMNRLTQVGSIAMPDMDFCHPSNSSTSSTSSRQQTCHNFHTASGAALCKLPGASSWGKGGGVLGAVRNLHAVGHMLWPCMSDGNRDYCGIILTGCCWHSQHSLTHRSPDCCLLSPVVNQHVLPCIHSVHWQTMHTIWCY